MRILDLFCCAGGAGYGYHQAGYTVVGVDIDCQPRYPFQFYQADALDYLARRGHEFDLIHASPPCQKYSRLNNLHKNEYPDLVEKTRRLLVATGKPYVIENVPGAPLHSPLLLCGTMFGIKTLRHRLFETEPKIYFPPGQCQHTGRTARKGEQSKLANCDYITITGHNFLVEEARAIYGTPWMTQYELAQAVPPQYTKWIGDELRRIL